ncbi:unnamed protein product [Linum trigynum]|uniref:Uncharacterized protein n=1 Tax=Linum trigynum TaxID=586398 RepID=A0AAV2G5M3_9ROSI
MAPPPDNRTNDSTTNVVAPPPPGAADDQLQSILRSARPFLRGELESVDENLLLVSLCCSAIDRSLQASYGRASAMRRGGGRRRRSGSRRLSADGEILAGRGSVARGKKFEGFGGPATAISRRHQEKVAVGGGTRGDGGDWIVTLGGWRRRLLL